MTQNYFTPIINADPRKNDAAIWNDPLGELDAEMSALNDAFDAIIIDDGTGNAEVIAARTRIVYPIGTPPSLLGDTVEYLGGGIANVLAFGADDTGVADSSSAVQAALAAADIVYFPPGTYLFNTAVTTGSDKTITGHAATLQIGSATPLSVTGNRVVIDGLNFVGTRTDHTSGTSATGGECLYIDCTANREDIVVRNCHFTWAARGIWHVSPSAVDPSITVSNLSISGCTFRDLSENGIAWRKTGATRATNYVLTDVKVSNCHFVDCWFAPSVYMAAIYIAGGVTIKRLAVTGCTSKNVMVTFISGSSTGFVEELTVTGCNVSGERTFVGGESNAEKIKTQMGLDLSGVNYLSVSGCSFDFVREECIALYTVTQFAITGCTFRRGNVGIALNHDNAATAGVGSRGVISGCAFTDMLDQSGTRTNKWGIQIDDTVTSAAPAHVAITGCRFDAGTLGMAAGIIIESLAHPDVQVSGCSFYGMARGIYLNGAFSNQIIVQGCRFEASTSRAIHANGTLVNSIIANCVFDTNAVDVEVATSTYLRCLGNVHNATTGAALSLGAATWVTVANSLFKDVGTAHSGTNHVGNPSNFVIWTNNVIAGTTTVHANSAGYVQLNQQDQKSFLIGTQPASGTWVTGDIAWDISPSASGQIGWVCTAGGTPGTWKAFGTIAA